MEKKNRWLLDEETKAKVKAMVIAHIDKIANFDFDIESCSDTRYEITLDLSDIPGVGPYHVKHIIEDLGYKEDSFDDNGWEMDYWFHFQHPESDKFPPLCLSGTAIIHEMYLRGEDNDYVTYAEREERLKNDPEFQELIRQGMSIIAETERLLQEDNNE